MTLKIESVIKSDISNQPARAAFFPEEVPQAEGYSFGFIARLCGLLCFVVINPLMLFMWFDRPKFVNGPVDAPEILVGMVTLALVSLGAWGLLINFAKTRISHDAIEWGVVRKKRLPFEHIRTVDNLQRFSLLLFPAVIVIRLTTIDQKVIEITGGTSELDASFVRLQCRYPKVI